MAVARHVDDWRRGQQVASLLARLLGPAVARVRACGPTSVDPETAVVRGWVAWAALHEGGVRELASGLDVRCAACDFETLHTADALTRVEVVDLRTPAREGGKRVACEEADEGSRECKRARRK